MKYKPGDVITECEPFAHCVNLSYIETRCHYCLENTGSLKTCTGCGVARYCGRTCQAKDWKNVHSLECKIFLKEPKGCCGFNFESELLNEDQLRLLLRVVLVLKKYPEKEFEMFDTIGGPRSFSSLMSHREEIFRGKYRWLASERAQNQVAWLQKNLGLERDYCEEIYGKMQVNSTGIVFKHKLVGSGVYIPGAIYDHDCSPSSTEIHLGIKLQIRALREIDTDRESPTISYVPPALPKEERQRVIERQNYFNCNCFRCSDDCIDFRLSEIDEEFLALVDQEEYSEAFIVGLRWYELALSQLPHLFPGILTMHQNLRSLLPELKRAKDPQFGYFAAKFAKHSTALLKNDSFLLEYYKMHDDLCLMDCYGAFF